MKYFFLIVAISLLSLPASAYAKISNTNELISAMQKKYGNSWYKTATFVQETTNFEPDGTSKVEIWYEAMSVPGSLRIDFTPTKDGNGILFTDGKIFVFKNGKVDSTRPFEHPLLILGFDIYRSPASEVTTKLQALKFDLSQFREATWQGRPVYRWRESGRLAFATILDRSRESLLCQNASTGRQGWDANAGNPIQQVPETWRWLDSA